MSVQFICTYHAAERMQQRAIPQFVIDLLFICGSDMRAGGADRLIFDKAALRRLRRHLGGERALRMIERWLDVYAVVSDSGVLVTVAHQTRRHRRP
ncbi:hypothetical protein [Xanthobacter wiegelii]|uniref:hypothetical protein n=1 Tax=Xanthobacter wiegelii TaxID=3119913 RepID=UPI00372A4BC6